MTNIKWFKNEAGLCRDFDLVNSKIQKIWKNRTKIASAFERNGSRIKRFLKIGRSDVDEALIKWLSNSEVTLYRLAFLF